MRGNLTKFEEMLDSFQTLHSNYAQFLDEEARKEDNEAWYKPRQMQIMAFVRRVNNWISQADDAGAPSEGGVASSAVMQEEEDPAESVNVADVDNTDAQSVSVSNRSNRSTLSSSLRRGRTISFSGKSCKIKGEACNRRTGTVFKDRERYIGIGCRN